MKLHLPVIFLRWALLTAGGCLVDRLLLGSATAGWPTYLWSGLLLVPGSSAIAWWCETRVKQDWQGWCAAQAGGTHARAGPASSNAAAAAAAGAAITAQEYKEYKGRRSSEPRATAPASPSESTSTADPGADLGAATQHLPPAAAATAPSQSTPEPSDAAAAADAVVVEPASSPQHSGAALAGADLRRRLAEAAVARAAACAAPRSCLYGARALHSGNGGLQVLTASIKVCGTGCDETADA